MSGLPAPERIQRRHACTTVAAASIPLALQQDGTSMKKAGDVKDVEIPSQVEVQRTSMLMLAATLDCRRPQVDTLTECQLIAASTASWAPALRSCVPNKHIISQYLHYHERDHPLCLQ